MHLPSDATLKKYGLMPGEWIDMYKEINGICPICKTEPSTGRFVIDHEHVAGWKHMKPTERKKYVRGLLCWQCNYFLMAGRANSEKMWRGYTYLRNYEVRITPEKLAAQSTYVQKLFPANNVKKRRANKPTNTTHK